MQSVNASSGRVVDSVLTDPDRRNFSGIFEGLQITASSRINSNTDLSNIEETRSNIPVEGGDLLVNKKKFDRQTHTHHNTSQVTNLSVKTRMLSSKTSHESKLVDEEPQAKN